MQFKNPKYLKAVEQLANDRHEKYKVFIDEYFAQVPDTQELISFDDVRAYFSNHENPEISAKTQDMNDGLLHDLCIRHGVDLV
jgi:hypothetical protein